jgi:hypothetical protein
MHECLVEFLAGLLLMVEGSEPRIKRTLQQIGFQVLEPIRVALPFGPLVFMGVVMVVAMLCVGAIVPQSAASLPLPLTVLLIGVTKTIGVIAAVVPKLRWSAFRPNSQGDPPYLAWLMSAALAAFVSFLIERAAFAIEYRSVSIAFDFGQHPSTPLAPMTFAIGLSIAIMCDVDVFSVIRRHRDFAALRLDERDWLLRIAEGMLCGAAMVIGLFICIHLLDIPSATRPQTSAWFPYVFSFSLGFIAGFVAPYLYRRKRSEEQQLQEAAHLDLKGVKGLPNELAA